ncbi:hypothetical protein [Chitinophaga caseinilytica]|uniref:hypothetical protein n=1 Tax=Chitinophaga caseinilytica TaxID=2267521 RepID=UPI003C2E2141
MKILQIPAIIVAALIIGLFTAFAVPKLDLGTVVNCYQNVTVACSSITLTSASSCQMAVAQVGKGANSASGFVNGIDCEGTILFCCAQLIRVNGPLCIGHTPINFTDKDGISWMNSYAKIQAVYCKN